LKDPSSQNSTSLSRTSSQRAFQYARKWIRKVWNLRGGGLYAVGYIVTFLYFEVTTFVSEIAASSGIVEFLTSQILEFALHMLIRSFENMIWALMWPAYIAQFSPPIGAIALGVAFIIFPKYIKPHLEKWLFD
jgi:hypothetical protein